MNESIFHSPIIEFLLLVKIPKHIAQIITIEIIETIIFAIFVFIVKITLLNNIEFNNTIKSKINIYLIFKRLGYGIPNVPLYELSKPTHRDISNVSHKS